MEAVARRGAQPVDEENSERRDKRMNCPSARAATKRMSEELSKPCGTWPGANSKYQI